MTTRRNFIKYTLAVGAGMFLTATIDPARVFASPEEAAQAGRRLVRRAAHRLQIPGGTLNPLDVPKFGENWLLVKPPAMPSGGRDRRSRGRRPDYYEIAVREFQQQVLPTSLPETTVWSYCSALNPLPVSEGGTLNYPAFTIEAKWKVPVRVQWINDLTDDDGNYLPHLLAIDPTLHWANPPGGTTGRDMRPDFTGKTYVATSTPQEAQLLDPQTEYTRYWGPVPMVTHVHGMVGVGDESDGYAEAWFLPDTDSIPEGYAKEGTWYEFFKGKALAMFGETWETGFATFQYPNDQRAGTLWYHDHTLGMTRNNVYAGPAGFFIIRGGPDDIQPADRLPGPAPTVGSGPFGDFYEIPIAIQDRSFNSDGSLFYPDTRAFFDGIEGPYIPGSDISPIWNVEFFGNTMVVNGRTWPRLNVEPRRYRFRLLNGCNSRFLVLKMTQTPRENNLAPNTTNLVPFYVIGTEGGFLPATLQLTDLLMGPAERLDVIVDFTGLEVGTEIYLVNDGSDAPFGGFPIDPAELADWETTGQVMKFVVGELKSVDTSVPPLQLNLPNIINLTGGTPRRLALIEMMSMEFPDAPAEVLLGVINATGFPEERMWDAPVTENPAVGATEVWEFYNFTADAHPMHIHEVLFQVVDRQTFETNPETGVQPTGIPRAPELWETGFKDTVIAYPGEVTRVRARFAVAGQYVWHCHIVEHEDNEMMRPYRIGPAQTGQPE